MDVRLESIELSVQEALAEDLSAAGDVTTQVSVPKGTKANGRILARAAGVLAGLRVAQHCFARSGPCEWSCDLADGDAVEPGQLVLTVRGDAAALLAAERTALNFMQRLSGVATATRQMVDAVAGTGAKILDTRKTTPGLRLLEKLAVVAGGGHNHRIGLFDQVLLKENHFAMAGTDYATVVANARKRANALGLDVPVIAEARNLDEARSAVRGGAGVVLLDNFAVPDGLRQGVELVRSEAERLGHQVEVEASGGVNLQTVRQVAETGVNRISVGAITHSAPALDLSMLIEPVGASR